MWFKGVPKLERKITFVPATKMTENTTNNLDSYFLKWISVWYIKRSIYIQKSKFTGHRQYSFLFLSQVFLLRLKRNSPQVLKSSSFKNLFFSLYVIDTTCFSEYFLFCVITGRNYFLWKFIITLRFFSNHHVVTYLKQVLLKNSIFHVISTLLTSNFKNKAVVYYNCHIFLTIFILW